MTSLPERPYRAIASKKTYDIGRKEDHELKSIVSNLWNIFFQRSETDIMLNCFQIKMVPKITISHPTHERINLHGRASYGIIN